MPRFFVAPENIVNDKINLYNDDVNHIINVLRLDAGHTITVCDSRGNDYTCLIETITKDGLTLKILNVSKNTAEPKLNVTLYQGLPKSDKMELIIQKCVELGITKIVPVTTERTIVKIKGDSSKKVERWQKISASAAKQSGRGIVPAIEAPVSFQSALAQIQKNDMAIMPYELERKKGIRDMFNGFSGNSIGLFIGPEGGFSSAEVDCALQIGVVPVSLGRRILRTETAGFVALTLIMYEIGDI